MMISGRHHRWVTGEETAPPQPGVTTATVTLSVWTIALVREYVACPSSTATGPLDHPPSPLPRNSTYQAKPGSSAPLSRKATVAVKVMGALIRLSGEFFVSEMVTAGAAADAVVEPRGGRTRAIAARAITTSPVRARRVVTGRDSALACLSPETT